MTSNIELSPEYLNATRDLKQERHVTSSFAFLRAHNGLRKGKLHVMMGSSHSGKSTLLRSIIIDALENNPDKKIFLFLSEESKHDFICDLADSNYRNEQALKRLSVVSAIDSKNPTSFHQLKFLLGEIKPDIFFFDNITTAHFYQDQPIKKQGEMIYELKYLARDFNIPFYLVVHSGADVTDNMRRVVEMNDVRGSKQIVNLAEFFYIAQTFHGQMYDSLLRKNKPVVRPCIFIKKHRGQKCESKMFYLNYNNEKRIYESDREMDFSEFKIYFKERNHL